ncbi:MAG: pilus assembly protein FlpE [Promicromonosporaceae bacterium]|nr:pilus assembly protein FlpE [Promicromonosporaceae bacterium]
MSANVKLIAVIGSRGGAGTSCLAASLAKSVFDRLGRGVLVDLCHGGPGIEVLLGIETEPGARWPQMVDARGEIDGTGLAHALPKWQGLPVLSVSRSEVTAPGDETVLDVVAALLRNGDTVVLDLPGSAAWTLATRALLSDADQVLVTSPDTAVGLAGAIATTLAVDGQRPKGPRATGDSRAMVLRCQSGSRTTSPDITDLTGWPVAMRYRDDRNLGTAIEFGAGPLTKSTKRLNRAGQALANELLS